MAALPLAGATSSWASDTPAAPSAAQPKAPSQTQWNKLNTVATSNNALGVFDGTDASHPVLVLPSGTSAGEKTKVGGEIPAGVDATVRTSRFTKDKLDQVQKAVTARKWSAEARTYGVSVAYDGQTDQVEVDTDAPASAQEALRKAYPGEVEVHSARLEPTSDRFDDATPFYGADALTGYNATCTAGFSVKTPNNVVYMVTAAHCYGWNVNIYNRKLNDTAGAYFGKVYFRDTTHDAELIGGSTYGYWLQTGGYASSTSQMFVHGKDSVVQGKQVCLSGSLTFNHCGHPISQTSISMCYASIQICIQNGAGFHFDRGGTNAPFFNNGTWAQPGDSGGPVYTHDNTGSAAFIVGILSGRELDTSGVVHHMLGVKVDAILSHFGVSVHTDLN
ncbi:hypothetical protein ACIRQQ_34285 [Streptomyces fuscichromogenes]|uniref:hypothetical protein n=1 Tax=Streptomyces fuscichromogenes TaxID=1324013 RepID=UPI0038081E68